MVYGLWTTESWLISRSPTPSQFTTTRALAQRTRKVRAFRGGPECPPLESGWINLHLLLWKRLLHLLTKVETEDAKFSEHEVWQAAWHRLERKAMAKQESTKAIILRADSRGDELDLERKGAPLAPIASFNEYGSLVWNDEFYNKVQSLATPPKKKNLLDDG